MSLRAAVAKVQADTKTGAPSKFQAFRDALTARQRKELDDVMADSTISDRAVALAIEAQHDRRFADGTIGYQRKLRRLR